MSASIELIARLLAYSKGRAQLAASHLRVAIQPDALVLCPLAMAGEDTTIHVVACGSVAGGVEVRGVPDPRMRDDQYELFEWMGERVERYFARCRSNEAYPQLWVASGAAAGHLDTLADRLRYNQLNPSVRRLGELLSYATERYPVSGQQTLQSATAALRAHWATGQQAAEDEHLGALLTWIDPPAGVDLLSAVAQAECEPMGVKTDPAFDREVLEPLVSAYNAARRAGASPAQLAHRAEAIQAALEPVVLNIYRATVRAIRLLAGAGLPSLPALEHLEEREAGEFRSFMASRDAGHGLSLRDKPKGAAFRLAGREDAVESFEAALACEDRVARAQARLDGRIVVGEVASPQEVRVGSHRTEYRFELTSRQRSLRLRRRDELRLVADPRLRVVVLDVHREGGLTRVKLRIASGQRAVGLPHQGATLELVPSVPDWSWIWRQRKQMSARLSITPWTHDAAQPMPAPSARRAAPADPLALVEGLR